MHSEQVSNRERRQLGSTGLRTEMHSLAPVFLFLSLSLPLRGMQIYRCALVFAARTESERATFANDLAPLLQMG